MQLPINKKKFASFSLKLQHKRAAYLLRHLFEQKLPLDPYIEIASWMNLHPPEDIEERFALHIRLAGVEYDFPSRHYDRLTSEPYLPIDIYLDGLRSAHNVGSIIRITEGMRLGTLHFANETPTLDNPKVEKTAMGAFTPFVIATSVKELRRPIIAIETTEQSQSLYSFKFPTSFSILVGNETRGLSYNTLKHADNVVEIPLYGSKNSLNVATAFSIIAYEIRRQLNLHPLS